MNAREAAETISQCEYGLHCLLIYRDLTTPLSPISVLKTPLFIHTCS